MAIRIERIGETASAPEQAWPVSPRPLLSTRASLDVVQVLLAAEILAARAAARLSRAAGLGGGTTVPGKLLWKLDPGAVPRLAARLAAGSALVSATHGHTPRTPMAAEGPPPPRPPA